MNDDDLHEFRASGRLRIGGEGVAVHSDLRRGDLDAWPSGVIAKQHAGAVESRITLAPHDLGDVMCHLTLRFERDRLQVIELLADDSSVLAVVANGSGPGGWTIENELARKVFHEAWMSRVLDRELSIKPWMTPDMPEPVMPAHPGPDHARHAVMPWGEVASHLDANGGFAYILVTYAPPGIL